MNVIQVGIVWYENILLECNLRIYPEEILSRKLLELLSHLLSAFELTNWTDFSFDTYNKKLHSLNHSGCGDFGSMRSVEKKSFSEHLF